MALTERHATRKEAVAQQLRKEILTCALRPGELLRDNELALRYGVSTSPLREAIVQLADERLIEMPPNRPKRVTPLTRQAAADFFAIYKVVALAGFSWGAPNVTGKHLRQMRDAYDALLAAIAAGDHYEAAISLRAFIVPVYEASGNAELLYMMTRRFSWLDRLVILFGWTQRPGLEGSLQPILDSFLCGNFTDAIWCHHEQINLLAAEIVRLPEREGEEGDGLAVPIGTARAHA